MTVNDAAAPADLDRTLAALADPTRRAILQRLTRGEARITDLAAPFDLSLNAISRHIQTLELAHLVTRRRHWREHLVCLNPAPLDEAAAWIDQTRTFWNARLDALESALKADDKATQRRAVRRARTPRKPKGKPR